MADSLPTGTATFLFTDIEGSTQLLQRLGEEQYRGLIEQHNRVLRGIFEAEGGRIPRTEGDSFFVVFPSAVRAVAAAVAAQRALAAASWPSDATVRVRMGLHTGEAILGGDDYVGIDVHRAARIAAAGNGSQVLMSETTRSLVLDALPEGVRLQDLGEHRLKDLARPERLFQADVEGLPTQFPPLRSLDAVRNNLPTQLTSFVGREAELEQARRLLATTRLLTLTGPGGTGKTRLSLQLAAEESARFADGVFFVPLAPISEPDLVASAVLQALGEQSSSTAPPRERLLATVRDKHHLLVLDNFEQVQAAAPLVADVLKAAPKVSVVVTSRSALHVYGERELPVPPLRLPNPRALPQDLQALSQFEAVRLFIERAMAVQPDFHVTNENAPAVAEICVRLDGLPLAIELAAARIKLLPPRAMLARLEHRLPLLSGGARDLPARQQTLRGAISWSYDVLDEPDRRLMSRCAVFAGGFDLPTAEAVCGPPDELGGMDVLDGLAALVDQSLLRQSEVDGEPRFWMLETIREFASEQLEASGEHDLIASRHADTFLQLSERAAPELTGSDQKRWLDTLDREHDNLRGAIGWCVARDRAETAMRLCFALWRFWHMRGHIAEGRERVAQALALPHGDVHPWARMKAHEAAGGLAYWQGDIPVVEVHYRAALALARELGDRAELANALYNVSFVHLLDQSDPADSEKLLAEAQQLFAEVDDPAGMARALWGRAMAAFWLHDFERSRDLADEALAAARAVDDAFGIAWDLHLSGLSRVKLGDLEAARPHLEEAMSRLHVVGDLSGVAILLDDFAELEAAAGNLDRALRLSAAATALTKTSDVGLVTLNRDLSHTWDYARLIPDWQTTAAWAEGLKLSTEQAVNLALRREEAMTVSGG